MPMPSQNRPRVAVFSLGGTIAMTTQPDGTVATALSAHDLLAAVPQLTEVDAELEIHDFRRLPGASLSFDDLFSLAGAIRNAVEQGANGVVVTQGTDTIEETAYFLDLQCSGLAPVVVTGAMRNPSMAGADGPANILAAVRTAADRRTPWRSLVVFADEIHAASEVRKTHSTSVTAFSSWPGPIGFVAEDRVHIQGTANSAPRIASEPTCHVRTALVTVALSDDGSVIEAVGAYVEGIVVAAFGAGHVPSDCVPALEKLAARIPVILATRTGRGPVLRKTYGFPGSESDLLSRGLISAGTLDPAKAKVLLHTALMTGATSGAIRDLFSEEPSHAKP
jgi:L-asparaginase